MRDTKSAIRQDTFLDNRDIYLRHGLDEEKGI